jgi:hypothetical protein
LAVGEANRSEFDAAQGRNEKRRYGRLGGHLDRLRPARGLASIRFACEATRWV